MYRSAPQENTRAPFEAEQNYGQRHEPEEPLPFSHAQRVNDFPVSETRSNKLNETRAQFG